MAQSDKTAPSPSRKAAGHRLRHDRARSSGRQGAARPRPSRPDLPAGGVPLLSRTASRRRWTRRSSRRKADGYRHIFVGYADCGTGGMLDRVLREAWRRAHGRAALLRLLSGHARLRGDRRRRHDVLLHDRFPVPAVRRLLHEAARPRPASGTRSRTISAITRSSSISPRPTIRSSTRSQKAPRNCSASPMSGASPAMAT